MRQYAAGGVALDGAYTKFDQLKIGYDNNADDDIDDAGDDLVVDEANFGTSFTFNDDHDDLTDDSVDPAGNMISDGKYRYAYDAWNRLVSVKSAKDAGATAFQTAEFYADGRRGNKLISNSGDSDVDIDYYYDGQKIVETRDGSGNVLQQFIHGTEYIDELVMVRVKDKGDLYVHQDANWNVIAATDMGGRVVERYVYTPYGSVTVFQQTGFGDYDGDGDVDATDKAAIETGGDCLGGSPPDACSVLDLDFDGDWDASDVTLFDALAQGNMNHPGRSFTGVDQPFAHQGLLFEPEIGSYQNRARQYAPSMRRFAQRDPLALRPLAGRGYQDGLGMYQTRLANPLVWTDPFGKCGCPVCPGEIYDGAEGWVVCSTYGCTGGGFAQHRAIPCVADHVTDPCLRHCICEHETFHAAVCNAVGCCRDYGGCDPDILTQYPTEECDAYATEAACYLGCSPPQCDRCIVDCIVDMCEDSGSGGDGNCFHAVCLGRCRSSNDCSRATTDPPDWSQCS